MIRINYFKELERVIQNKKNVFLFGAGMIGKTYAYDYIRTAGGHIVGYFDNNICEGTEVRDGKKVLPLDLLGELSENDSVFVTVHPRYQKQLIDDLECRFGIECFVFDGQVFGALINSIVDSDDMAAKERYFEIIDDSSYLKNRFKEMTGDDLDIDNPTSFNEKLQWLKLHNRNPKYTECVDKYLAKKHIEKLLGKDYLIPTIGIWDSPKEIEWGKLPEKVVLKCTHDSGSTIIVNQSSFDIDDVSYRLSVQLDTDYYWIGREWPYKNVCPRIIAEPYIADNQEMMDYKFMCFNGRVESLFVCTDRMGGTGLKVTFFDTDWNRLPFERHYPSDKREIEKPENLHEMVRIAEELSRGIPFVRIDLYDIQGRILFGEMTFFPGGGMEEFTPKEWDEKYGKLIVL